MGHDVLLITSVGGPLVAWAVLGIQVTEGQLINVDLTATGLDRILFELETDLKTRISLCYSWTHSGADLCRVLVGFV